MTHADGQSVWSDGSAGAEDLLRALRYKQPEVDVIRRAVPELGGEVPVDLLRDQIDNIGLLG